MIRLEIVGLADIHGDVEAVRRVAPRLTQAHAILLLGDITDFGGAAEAAKVVDVLAEYNPRILAVPGNCDRPEVGEYLRERGASLGSGLIIDGVAFIGVGGSLPCPGGTPNEMSEEQLAAALAATGQGLPPGIPTVLVTHQPPYDTEADIVAGGRHVGSRSLREYIREHQPLLNICGHIHESRGMDRIGSCRVVNPGPLGEGRYAWAMLGQMAYGYEVLECEIERAWLPGGEDS